MHRLSPSLPVGEGLGWGELLKLSLIPSFLYALCASAVIFCPGN